MLEHLTEFIGRTHLVVLHFPIALLIVAALIELSRALTPRIQRRAAEPFRPGITAITLVAIALLSTAYAVVSGLILGFDEPAKVDLHRIFGIATGVLVLALCVSMLAALRATSRTPALIYLALLGISAVVVGYTGHLGGNLTHGTGFITRPLAHIFNREPAAADPIPIATLNPADFALSQAQLDTYLDTIQPIFDNHCIECHGAEKAENDVRLDAIEYVLDPTLEILVHGDADASEIVYLIELPTGDPDIMPPEDDADPLNPDQIEAIRAWVESLGS
ncbi:MAG: hypothetical protein KDA29_03040 [Phycisphaerales bacterium]|nr:hypothetical protein [Phycisphaerales bacterium]